MAQGRYLISFTGTSIAFLLVSSVRIRLNSSFTLAEPQKYTRDSLIKLSFELARPLPFKFTTYFYIKQSTK